MIDFLLQPLSMILLVTAYLSYIHDRNTQREADNIQRNIEHLLNTFEEYEHKEQERKRSKNYEKQTHQHNERLGLKQKRVKVPKK